MAMLDHLLKLPQPDRSRFINPWNHRGWIDYFTRLLPRFQFIRFLGLPVLKDTPDIPLERLYVPLNLGPQHVSPDQVEQSEKQTIEEVLSERRWVVALGDPGSGKSTLINYLTTTFASRQRHPLVSALGPMIPVPIVLRDFRIAPDISFDGLLDQFLAQPFWSGELSRDDLIAVMETGQALVMLDGLDEIGDLARRRALRRAVLDQGVGRFLGCTWIVTSRMVGYDEVPFDVNPVGQEPVAEQDRVALEALLVPSPAGGVSVGVAAPLYILPFTMDQIRRFAENWYGLREADAAERARGAESLMGAIGSSQSIERLAHTPNLLTMMALIHRVYAQLPSGRALLYDRIAEAYLESIDTYRGIRVSSVPLALQQRWLGELAYEMQRERASSRADASEILVPAERVEQTIQRTLSPEYDAKRELGYIGRRAGLLLPRKPGFYSFVHLSFQEYFAACYLYERLMGFDSREEAQKEVMGLSERPVWHETLVFLFEKLSAHQGASDWLFARIFLQSQQVGSTAASLAADLLGDQQSGLSPENQTKAARLVLREGRNAYNDRLTERVNGLPETAWSNVFLPSLWRELEEGPPPTPALLLFFQNLKLLSGEELESLLVPRTLSAISEEDLYFLYPLAWTNDGPVRREVIERMPVRLWLANDWFAPPPVYCLVEREILWTRFDREDFLTWASDIAVLLDCLSAKGGVTEWDAGLEEARALGQARALARTLDRARALDRARNRARARTQALGLALVLNRAQALTWPQARDRALAAARALARVLMQQGELRFTMRVAASLLGGDDHFVLPAMEAASLGVRPFQVILHRLAQLVLGHGGPEAWREIHAQVDILSKHRRARPALPFLRNGEMVDALELLGLRMKDGWALFDAGWFAAGHPLAAALNARPSQFAARIQAWTRPTP